MADRHTESHLRRIFLLGNYHLWGKSTQVAAFIEHQLNVQHGSF